MPRHINCVQANLTIAYAVMPNKIPANMPTRMQHERCDARPKILKSLSDK